MTQKAISMPPADERGLDEQQVRERVERGETNAMATSTSRSLAQIIRSNVFTLFNAIIAVATVMVLLAGSWKDAVFGLVIVINTGIGIVTELRSKHTLDRLAILVASRSLVRRSGHDVEIPHGDIVLGDLLWIRSGEQVPADSRIVRTWGLELDESMLTGESRTVRHHEGDTIYSGSTAVSGVALAEVRAVGESGYAAKLTAQAKVYKKTVSDLNRGINAILRFMTFLVVPLCVLLMWSQIRAVGGWDVALATGSWRQAVVSAVAGVVGMIPEGLVLLTSLNFAIAAMRLARENTLVQELESVETLARVDDLNLDKTGTITDGTIACRTIHAIADGRVCEHPVDRETLEAVFDLADERNPNATSRAVLSFLAGRGMSSRHVRGRIPFSSARKWSAVGDGAGSLWYWGAPEILLGAFDGDYRALEEQIASYANAGNRMLLVARAQVKAPDGIFDEPLLMSQCRPVALVECSEHIRPDAESTLAWFRDQGVRCRIISGDNPATVGAIAARVRLTGGEPPVTMDARELPRDAHELAGVLDGVDVLGRVLPEQKKLIVQALHVNGHVVAMTGDGVNDALAIKEADLGIAMGNAAPATKAVAQVVLVDSVFSHLPDVVARGRQVMANMERVASLFLVKTVYSALISLGVVLSAIPFPYLPRHITYIGGLTIGIPAFILALAPNTRRYIPGFLRRVVRFALPGGIAIAVSVLCTQWVLPPIMGWDVTRAADLGALRNISACVVFALGILVLARVASPLRSWRGVLVFVFGAAGVIGACIPQVADFFALRLPTGATLVALIVVLVASVAVFFVCQRIARVLSRVVSHGRRSRRS
ncbi:MAG: HAD-IC family P-type ATPase [Bifidobacterium sp.]|jgi:cation-transporting ATPase E